MSRKKGKGKWVFIPESSLTQEEREEESDSVAMRKVETWKALGAFLDGIIKGNLQIIWSGISTRQCKFLSDPTNR